MDRAFEFLRQSTSRIVVGRGVEARLPPLLRELGARDVVVVHDDTMHALGQRVAAPLRARCLPVPAGERAKDLQQIASAASRLRATGADRGTTLLALGGGSVSDCTGFLAAIYLRGVRFVACPTTSLALCDAAIGGKNGVDFEGRKNELGTIRQPDLIAADIDWLATLPLDRHREGFVEAVKMAAVLDAAHFARLARLAPALAARDPAATDEAIDLAIAMKMAVVLADETESDRRRWLNFGHTIGHALESLAGGALRHGECVAIGMLAECRAAGTPATVVAPIAEVLAALGAPTVLPREFADATRLWSLAAHDKKAQSGVVPMIVPASIGSGTLTSLSPDALARAIA